MFKIRATRQTGRTQAERIGEARTVTGLRFAVFNMLRVLSELGQLETINKFNDAWKSAILVEKLAVGRPYAFEIAGVKFHITMDDRND